MLNTHQEYGVTSRHIRCTSWDKRSTPYLVCIARFFFYSVYIQYCGYSKSHYIFTTMSFQEGPHQKLFFHLQESEDERRAMVDDIGKDLAHFLMGTIFLVN